MAIDHGDLGHLQMAEPGRTAQRRPDRPVDEVGRAGVPDDPTPGAGPVPLRAVMSMCQPSPDGSA